MLSHFLDQFVLNIFREKLRNEREDTIVFVDVLLDNFLVLFQPGNVSLGVFILQSEILEKTKFTS